MTPLELLQNKRDDIRRIAIKHGAYNLRVFGSVARGEAKPESDIDLLIEKGQQQVPGFLPAWCWS
jgi:predicted nucleotidyltransferase